MDEDIIFHSEYGDYFWAGIIIPVILGIVLSLVFKIWIIPLIFVLIIIFIIVASYYIRYTFRSDRLIVECPLALNEPPILYDDVTKVVCKRIFTYSLGMSSDSVLIYCGKRLVCISPKNKNEFVHILKEHCPGAVFEIG